MKNQQLRVIVYFGLCKEAFLRCTERAQVIVKAAAIFSPATPHKTRCNKLALPRTLARQLNR